MPLTQLILLLKKKNDFFSLIKKLLELKNMGEKKKKEGK